MKKLMATLAGLAFCATALAADPGGADSNEEGAYHSQAKYDMLLGRLKLTDEQAKKINALYVDYQKRSREAAEVIKNADISKKVVTLGNGRTYTRHDKEIYRQISESSKDIVAERDKKIFEALTGEQQKKYELGRKIVAEGREKMSALSKEYPKVRAEFKGDRQKMMEAYQKLGEKRRAIYAEQNKQLDEKLGKLPARAMPEMNADGVN